MNYISKTISKQAAIVSLSAFILITAIAGLIMDASGVPWYSEGQDYDFDSETYSDYEGQDWEECCEEQYESFLDDSDYEDGYYDTAILSISPMTGYFVLILIFSVLCMICAIIPFDVRYKVPTVTLFGLATTVSGIFLARKSAVTLAIYLSELSNSGGRELGSHAHVMIYFGAFLSMICLLLGSLIIASVKDLLSQDSKVSRGSLKRAQIFLSISLIVFLLSPLVPISYLPYESDQIDDNDPEGIYLFPVTMLAIDDWVSSDDDGYDDDDMDVASSTIGNYALVEDLFFVLMWINLSVIMLMSMALLPVAGKGFSSLGQLNILSAPLIVLALIFSIIMFVNLPDLLGDDGLYNESRYEAFYFHVNWLPLICCIVAVINWVILLIKSHIPWWKEMGQSSQKVFANFGQSPNPSGFGNQNMMQGGQQQQFNQQQFNQQQFNQQQFNQQQFNQQQFNQQQFGRQPPGF